MAPEAKALQVLFQIRTLDIDKALFSCAPGEADTPESIKDFKADFFAFISKAKESGALETLACRYVRNIANGRFLWRNRTVADSVTVKVALPDSSEREFDALATPFNHFEGVSDDERAVAKVLAQGWKGAQNRGLKISARIAFGITGRLQVFPSQNYFENKPRGMAFSLYSVGEPPQGTTWGKRFMGQAALRDQKIGNALRTIDTWYPAYEERLVPISVEPNGANLDMKEFFRKKGDASGFKLMQRVGELDPETPEGLFLLACLIRGGVFSGKA